MKIDPNFKLLFESSPGLYLVLTPDLEIVAVTDAYLQATMTKRNEILGKKLFDVFPDNPDDLQATGTKNLRASLECVLTKKIPDTMAIQKYDIRRPESEGGGFEERHWSPVNSPVLDENNELIYIIHRVEDVTPYIKLKAISDGDAVKANEKIKIELFERNKELKEAQNALMMSNSLLNGIIQGSGDIIIAMDLDFNLVHYNTAFVKEYYKVFSHDVYIGMNVIEDLAFLPEDQNKALDAFQRTLRDGEYKTTDEYGDENCERNYYDIVYNVLKNDKGETIGLFHIARNVSDKVKSENALKRSEEALRKVNAELESFSYSISHDLRAPLRAITGFSKILQDKYLDLLPEEGQHFLNMVKESASEMGYLIDDLLAFSRLGRQSINKEKISMNELVKVVLSQLRLYDKNKAEVSIEDLPPAYADWNFLKQVMMNLLSNAFKFSSKVQEPKIVIGSKTQNGTIIYYIKDNGVGFNMAYANKLFGVFQRLHRQEEYEGTGVGLAIVERIITKHGGKIWAQSEVNKGSTFFFTLGGGDDDGN